MAPLPCPSWSGPTQEGLRRALSVFGALSPRAQRQTLSPACGQWPASIRGLGWSRTQASEARQVISASLPGPLRQEKAGHKPFPLSCCSHLEKWGFQTPTVVGTFLASPISTFHIPMASLCPPPPLPAPQHTASRRPVTITGEDKWPHSGTPCQICL